MATSLKFSSQPSSVLFRVGALNFVVAYSSVTLIKLFLKEIVEFVCYGDVSLI